MDITVSSPGSPGTSFTDNVKEKIVIIFDVLASHPENFASVRDLGTELEKYGINWNYARNILTFMQNCGIVDYQDVDVIVNDKFFTNIGYAYVDILKTIKIVKDEPESTEREEILSMLEKIQEEIYFQCLVIMMKNKECNYSHDFFDVLCFAKKYGSIDSTEYYLIQYERERGEQNYLEIMGDTVKQYRDGSLTINVRTKTKKAESGAAKSVNSFPYVQGNFIKAGVFYKGNDSRYYIVNERIAEIDNAIKEVGYVRV